MLRYASYDERRPVEGAMPKPDEVWRRHADAAKTWRRFAWPWHPCPRTAPMPPHTTHQSTYHRALVFRHSSNDGMRGMGPGAPGFPRAHPICDMGKLSLAHATRRQRGSCELRASRSLIPIEIGTVLMIWRHRIG